MKTEISLQGLFRYIIDHAALGSLIRTTCEINLMSLGRYGDVSEGAEFLAAVVPSYHPEFRTVTRDDADTLTLHFRSVSEAVAWKLKNLKYYE